MKLIGLLVLLGPLSLVEGRLGFAPPPNIPGPNCNQFFLNNNPPAGLAQQPNNNYQEICQIFHNGLARYATLYDTDNRIPVYSAYRFTGWIKKLPHGIWKIEPQLDIPIANHNAANGEMQTQAAAQLPGLLAHQAVDADYVGPSFQRGHLYPRNHNTNDAQVHATYTLTNAAPQRGADNRAWYHHMESKIIEYIDAACEDREAFIVTGVVPGNNYMHILAPGTRGRVNIPGYFWSAFCCEEAGNPGTFTSGGYTMQMGVGAQNADVHDVGNLNNLLTGYYNLPAGQNVMLFGQQAGCS